MDWLGLRCGDDDGGDKWLDVGENLPKVILQRLKGEKVDLKILQP